MNMSYPTRQLPILSRCDVLVAGGSITGIAAALRLAQAGKKVFIVESRTYLGREISAVLRPWLKSVQTPFSDLMSQVIQAAGEEMPEEGQVSVRMDHFKIFLEDILLNAGVKFLYACYPVQVLAEDGRVRGLVIANKSGRQVIECQVILDATETALVTRLAGAQFEPEPEHGVSYRRTVEYISHITPERVVRIPEHLGVAGNVAWLHMGARAGHHKYLEFEMQFPAEESGLETAVRREIVAREKTIELAAYLLRNNAQFDEAYLASAAYELHGHKTTRMAGAPQPWSHVFEQTFLPIPQLNSDPLQLPVPAFVGPLGGLWCLGDAAFLSDDQRDLFLDPVPSAWIGQALGQFLTEKWDAARTMVPAFHAEVVSSPQAAGDMEIREPETPQPGRAYSLASVPASTLPIIRESDVLVAGGGTSGAIAALAAAREGARTVLVEMNPGLGGTGTLGGVPEYWMGNKVGFVPEIQAAVKEMDRQIGYVPPDRWHQWSIEGKMCALLEMERSAGVEVFFFTMTTGTLVEGNCIRGVVAATPYGPAAFMAEVTIDATGDGDVAAFAGADFVYGAERDHTVMWYSLPQIAGPGFASGGNFASMVNVSNIEDYTRALLSGRRRRSKIHDHGVYLAPRESRHILGDVTLTYNDMLLHRRWPDVINIFYSNYDVKGKSTTDWNLVGLVGTNLEVELPYRALIPRRLEAIIIAGKAYSARSDALPLARMQPDIENLGGVAGIAAAMTVHRGCLPRELPVRILQERLVEVGLLPGSILNRRLQSRHLMPAEMRRWAAQLDGERALYELNNLPEHIVFRERIPFVEICTAGPAIIPLLAQELEMAEGNRQVLIAQALAMCGNSTGVPVLVERIREQFGENGLPARTSFILNTVQHLPDQGAMPDAAYLVYSLGMARDPRSLPVWKEIAERLNFTMDDFKHPYKSIFNYVDAVCYGAERLGDPAALPILEQIHSQPLLHGQVLHSGFQEDFMLERLATLELAIARAMARCGSVEGYSILIDYLEDVRGLLADQSHSELVNITGQDYGKDPAAWNEWLKHNAANIKPKPWDGPTDAIRAWGEEILIEKETAR